jgi:hypothetical protein
MCTCDSLLKNIVRVNLNLNLDTFYHVFSSIQVYCKIILNKDLQVKSFCEIEEYT